MSATTSPVSSLSQSGTLSSSTAAASNVPDPNQDSGNQYAWGPSIYLYGLLVILIFVFLVFICIAWKGYRTRRELRMRSELALARGLNKSATAPNLSPPIMYEGWIMADEKGTNIGPSWDIKPTAISAIRPIVAPLPASQQPGRPPLQRRLFGFNRRTGEDQQGQPLSSRMLPISPNPPSNTNPTLNGEKTIDLSGAEGVGVTVLIALPNPARPSREKNASNSPSPLPGSTHRSGPSTSTVNSTGVSHESEELPELVLGISDVNLQSTPSPNPLEHSLGGRTATIPPS